MPALNITICLNASSKNATCVGRPNTRINGNRRLCTIGCYVPLASIYHPWLLCTIPGCYVPCMAAMYLAAMYHPWLLCTVHGSVYLFAKQRENKANRVDRYFFNLIYLKMGNGISYLQSLFSCNTCPSLKLGTWTELLNLFVSLLFNFLSVYSFIKKDEIMKQVPLCFVLMSRKKKKDYEAVIRKITELTSASACEVVVDFEKALWSAVRVCLPEASIHGCWFH